MRRDFNNIVGGVRVGLREVRDDDFVDAGLRALPRRTAEGGCPHIRYALILLIWLDEFSEDCAALLQIMLQPQHRRCDLQRSRPGEAHHSDSTAAGGRRDGDDGVMEIHAAIVTGKLGKRRWSIVVGRGFRLPIEKA